MTNKHLYFYNVSREMLIITNQNIAIFLVDIFKKDKSSTGERN